MSSCGKSACGCILTDGKDFTSLNMSFSQSYSPNMRGLVTLPCVEVVTRLDDMREDAEVVRVVIQQTDPDPVAESSCIVRILDRREEGVVGEAVCVWPGANKRKHDH